VNDFLCPKKFLNAFALSL